MPPNAFGDMQARVDALGGQLSILQAAMAGVDPQNLQQFFVMHRHGGNALDGAVLYGPYFIKDTANGHTYKLTCTNGTLGVSLVV